MWLRSLNHAESSRTGKLKHSSNHKESMKRELTAWFESNLESVYAAACQGLLDNEEMVRRTSLHVLGKLSISWPHHALVDVPLFPMSSSVSCLDSDLEHTDLVDDAFSRVCSRIQDPSRYVRQLAAQIMSDLAKFVTEDCLLQTLEKTVMSDRQVRRSLLEQYNNTSKTAAAAADIRTQGRHSGTDSVSLIATGSNGAVISGLEDDYFEVRCTTLATVTHIASLSTRFASNCQDLLVDMLTDDIQDVRLAAVRALSAVGDKVPVKSEQVSIITSALAEGSGRIRRRLHHLLSQCRLASAPCLISLLDGLLQNLRRYPEDRDNLWRCAASVGRNHPVFVETCLSSLLRTHSWLSGPEPVKEDPAYLTVLLLVLNAEPNVPGMQAKFPRHVASTKIYLQELLPSLLPKTPVDDGFQDYSPTVIPNKKLCLDNDCVSNMPGSGHYTLYKLVASIVCRIQKTLSTIHDELHHYCLPTAPHQTKLEENGKSFHRRIPSYEYQSRRNSLLYRLVFNDLWNCAKKLDHIERLNNLLYWLKLLSTTGWYLVSTIVLIHFNSSRTQSTRGIQLVNNNNNNTRVNNNYQLNNSKENTNTAMHRRIIQLLSKLVRNSLKMTYLFSGKTKHEALYVSKLYTGALNALKSFTKNKVLLDFSPLVNALNSLVQLLNNPNQMMSSNNNNNNNTNDNNNNNIFSPPSSPPVLTVEPSVVYIPMNRKRSLPPMELDYEQSSELSYTQDDKALIDYLMDLSKRLIPVYAILIQPSNLSSIALNLIGAVEENDKIGGIGGSRSMIPFTKYQDTLNENDSISVVVNSMNNNNSSSSNNNNSRIHGNNSIIPEIRFTAIIASAMIRIRALIVGLSIDVARKHVCIIFRRPEPSSFSSGMKSNSTNTRGILYHWWPPMNSWHLLDEDISTSSTNQNYLEIRTHIQLTAGRWSDSGTIELGLGYCIQPTDYNCSSSSSSNTTVGNVVEKEADDEEELEEAEDCTDTDEKSPMQLPFVIPLTPISLLSKVKLVPCAPVNQW
nr:unnamed protein product [Trichobilharzia regenti]